MRYPELPYFNRFTTAEVRELYNEVSQWQSDLVRELESRDEEVRYTPSTQLRTVVTTTDAANALGGEVIYSTSTGQAYCYSAVSSTWNQMT